MVTRYHPGGGKSVEPPYTKQERREYDARVFNRRLNDVKTITVHHAKPRGEIKPLDRKPDQGSEE